VKAQRDLLAANARLLKLLMVPMLLLLVPFGGLFAILEGMFGRAPLRVSEATVVTLQLRQSQDVTNPTVQVDAPEGFAIETPAVRIPADAQISWRVRALAAVDGRLKIHCNGYELTKAVSASGGWPILSGERGGTVRSFLMHPLELPFSMPAVESIRIEYPAATVYQLPWLIWFTLASIAGGFAAVRLG
jgi:hypothetical protein